MKSLKVPYDLWKKLKEMAFKEDKTIYQVIEDLISLKDLK